MTLLPLQGSLAETSVPKLLLDLYRDNYSGALSLESQRIRKKIFLHQGAPVAAESELASETLCVHLVATNVITREDVTGVEQAMARKRYEESSALLELGLLKPRDLFNALKELVRLRAMSCFPWSDGSYALCVADAPADDIQSFRADPLALVQEGLETTWTVDRMLQALGPRMDRYPVATRALNGAIIRLRTDDATDTMLRKLDGSSSLGEVIGGAVRSPRALAAVWVIDASGLLRYRDSAIDSVDDDEEPEVEIEIMGAPQAAAPRAVGAKAAKGPAEQKETDDRADAMRSEIIGQLENLADLDFYQLLKIEPDAGAGAIKKAYFQSAKRYHPDALARLGLDTLKQEAATVFSRMAEAYEVLGNSQKREEYDAALESGEPAVDTAALAQAESFFRKGEVLVRMGDFRGALQFLENAVQLWPDEAEYQSTLGWALYKKNPPELERAREHLEQAIALAPQDAVSHFRVGIVLGALGETQAAKTALARAKQLDPSAVESR